MGHGTVRLAGLQFAGLQEQQERNADLLERLARQAAAEGSQVLLAPEVVLTGFVGGERERAMAEPIPGPATERFGALAAELGVHLMYGLSELREGQVYNSIAVHGPDGALRGVMRKVHINRYETPGGWRNGSAFPVWEFATPTGSFCGGIMICYDRELPESARLLMLQGAELILNPLACTCPTDDIHRCLLRTRAFENEAHLLVVNHAAPRQNGHSMAIAPNGDITAELGDAEGLLHTTIDLDALAEHRRRGIYGRHHRRPELYGPLADPAGQLHPPEANLPPESGDAPRW